MEDDARALRAHLDVARAERSIEQERAAHSEAAEVERRFEELLRTLHSR